MNTYEVPIVLISDKVDWYAPKDVIAGVIDPPKYQRLQERPKKGRKKAQEKRQALAQTIVGVVIMKVIIKEVYILSKRKMRCWYELAELIVGVWIEIAS